MASKVSSTFGLISASMADERQVVLEIVLVVVDARRAAAAGTSASTAGDGGLGRAPRRPRAARSPGKRPLRRAGLRPGIGRLQVDDLAQQDVAGVQLVAPDDDGLEGQRAFAQARDHRLAAGLDALGDGDLALARQQLDRAHLAQIHAHRIVGAVGRLACLGLLGDRGGPPRPARGPRRVALARRLLLGARLGLLVSSDSTTLMPMSLSMAIVSSICSEVTSSEGRTSFSSSMVT